MDFKQEDFPLYQLLLKNNEPGIEFAKADFEAACAGGDEERYGFAQGIQTVAANIPASEIPGCTQEIMDTTLKSCLAIFKDVASRGHKGAVFMVADFESRGLGLG